jgi:3D (Asp-Asp-Asp) domain-containing protein
MMKKKHLHVIPVFLLSLICFVYSAAPALAADTGYGPGADTVSDGSADSGESRVVTAGSGRTAAADDDADDTRTDDTAVQKGESLGMHTTTGYTAGDYPYTYSGTIPRAGHTISADLEIYPLGTRLIIGDTVYTVEDCGSSVNGNFIDIYYDTYEEAYEHGMKTEEVFAVME